MPVPALEALLGLDEHGTCGRIDVDGREPLDPREAVSGLATPLRVREVSDESVRVRRFQPERDQTPPRLRLDHRAGNALSLKRRTRQPRSPAIARSLRSGFTATA